MCGITGMIQRTGGGIDPAEMDAFTDILSHRGPDGRGTWYSKQFPVALGHRRLAILDLSDSGAQPMHYKDRYSIVFNGEIFNYLELREELRSYGYIFTSDTDTEVILAAYDKWGEKFQEKLNGMWALAIWDDREKTLFLSRDRFGVKPLYYLDTDSIFAFASELKAFFQLRCYTVSFDNDFIAETIIHINGVEGVEGTMLNRVYKVLPGHCVIVETNGRIKKYRWWNTESYLVGDVSSSSEDRVERFRELFADACRIRLRSDVPIASTLSGGLDSSSIVSVVSPLAAKLSIPYHAFIARFSGVLQDEVSFAKQVVEFHKIDPIIENIDLRVTPREILQTVWHAEDIYWVPLVGPLLLYRAMKKRNTVVSLDGHGSDELLGGYHFFALRQWLYATMRGSIQNARMFSHVLEGMRGGSVSNIPQHSLSLAWQAFHTTPIAEQLRKRSAQFRPPGYLAEPIRNPRLWYEGIMAHRHGLSSLGDDLYAKFHYSVLPTILRNFDRISMANGVEVRSPFLDWRLVTYAFRLNDNERFRDGMTKIILRDAMKGYMPEQVRLRRNKMGFTSSIGTWLQGPLREWLLDTISQDSFRSSSIWNGDEIIKHVHIALRQKDTATLEAIWPYINAHMLLQLLPNKQVAS